MRSDSETSLPAGESTGTPPRPALGARIDDALVSAAAQRPGKTALIDGTRAVSYELLAQWSAEFARDLRNAGLAPGDRVSIYLEKSAEAVAALYGTWLAGGVVVPINDALLTRQVDHIVQHSGSRFFVSNPRRLARLAADVMQGLTVLEVRPPGSTRADATGVRRGGDEPAAILYTSGSTGRPKGILISHENLIAGARIVSGYLDVDEADRVLAIPPFNFDYGLNQLLTTVRSGATLVLQRSPLPADICRALVAHEITGMPAVAPLWIQLVQETSPFTRMSFPHLRYATNTGGALPVEVVRQLRETLGHVHLYLMYGFSEAFRSTYLDPAEVDRRPASIGKAIPETEIFILSADGRRCGPGEVGELVHRGPTVSLGYWADPSATAALFRPNPFGPPGSTERVAYSGDLVRTDDDGFVYFVSRRDEMIKSQGFRISPTEVEEIVFSSTLVKEVVAKGEPDALAGSVVAVHCVPADVDRFSPDELTDYCRREMPRYMVPRRIYVHDAFPRTASGKIDRKALGA